MNNKQKKSFLFKKKQPVELIDYCAIEPYNNTGFVATLSGKHFVEAVRSLIKESKNLLNADVAPDNISVKLILKEQIAKDEPYGRVIQVVENVDAPVFNTVTEDGDTYIELTYSLRAFNGKILDFANKIIRVANKSDDKMDILDKPVRICVPDIYDNFIEFNWSCK